jgi:CheY-like chemotaxis protein
MMAKILVADDQVEIRKLIAYRLEKSGYQVVLAEDGLEAIQRVKTEPFDLAILDISMPKMTGLEVLEYIRNYATLTDLPVIMLTASALADHESQAREHSANAYLAKPVSSQELNRVVADLLEKSG